MIEGDRFRALGLSVQGTKLGPHPAAILQERQPMLSLRVVVLGFGDQNLESGSRVQGLGFGIQGLGLRA